MRFSSRLLGTLSILTMVVAAQSAATARTIVARNTPICYVQLRGQAMKNLNEMCGVGRKSTIVDLAVDANRDGVPDQLLALLRTHRESLQTARSSADYRTAQQALNARLPYSSQVRQLQAQQYRIQEQIQSAPRSQHPQLYRQLSDINRRMYRDPSYTQVQKALNETYRELYRNR